MLDQHKNAHVNIGAVGFGVRVECTGKVYPVPFIGALRATLLHRAYRRESISDLVLIDDRRQELSWEDVRWEGLRE